MKRLRRQTVGLIGFWGLCATVGVAACGNSFDSDDCKANRTCPPADAGTGNSASGEAGTPSDGGADSTPGGTAGTGAEKPAELGGAGGEGGAVAVNPPPGVLSVTPTDAQSDVETSAVVSVTFSEPLAATTVNATSLKLTRGGKEVSGAVTYADSVATFKPTRPLALLGEYELTVTTDVTDAEGAALAAPFKSKFVVRDGQFNVITAVEEDVQYLADGVPVESDGSVLLAWTDQSDGADCPVLYQRFLRGVGIGSVEPLSAEDATSCSLPTAASSASGVSAIAWAEYRDNRPVNVVQFREGKKLPRFDVSKNSSSGGYLSLGIADNGVLSIFDSDGNDVWGYRSDPEGEWSSQTDTVATSVAISRGGRVAFDASGNGLSLWVGTRENLEEVFGSRFTAAAGKWSSATVVPGGKATKVGESFKPRMPALAMAPQGNAAAMWFTGDSAKWQLMVSRYEPANGWATATPIGGDWSGGSVSYESPALVFDGETFVAAFTAHEGSKLQTWVTRLDLSSGEWSTPEKRQAPQDTVSDEVQPRLATDGHGNLILTWFGGLTPTFKPYYQRYRNKTWSATKSISSTPTSRTVFANLSSNEDGLAAFTWTDVDGIDGAKIYLASFY